MEEIKPIGVLKHLTDYVNRELNKLPDIPEPALDYLLNKILYVEVYPSVFTKWETIKLINSECFSGNELYLIQTKANCKAYLKPVPEDMPFDVYVFLVKWLLGIEITYV